MRGLASYGCGRFCPLCRVLGAPRYTITYMVRDLMRAGSEPLAAHVAALEYYRERVVEHHLYPYVRLFLVGEDHLLNRHPGAIVYPEHVIKPVKVRRVRLKHWTRFKASLYLTSAGKYILQAPGVRMYVSWKSLRYDLITCKARLADADVVVTMVVTAQGLDITADAKILVQVKDSLKRMSFTSVADMVEQAEGLLLMVKLGGL